MVRQLRTGESFVLSSKSGGAILRVDSVIGPDKYFGEGRVNLVIDRIWGDVRLTTLDGDQRPAVETVHTPDDPAAAEAFAQLFEGNLTRDQLLAIV